MYKSVNLNSTKTERKASKGLYNGSLLPEHSSPTHSRWCFIVGHKWLSASVCLPASNLWFRDSLGECTSSDSADNSIWENDPSFLVRHKISHLTFKLLTRGIWKKSGQCQPSWCFLSSGSLGLRQTNLKADSVTLVFSPNGWCWSHPCSGTSISCRDLLEFSTELILIFRVKDFFSPLGLNQCIVLEGGGEKLGCGKGSKHRLCISWHNPRLECSVPAVVPFCIHAWEANRNEPSGEWKEK